MATVIRMCLLQVRVVQVQPLNCYTNDDGSGFLQSYRHLFWRSFMVPSPFQILMATVIRMFLSQDKLVLIKNLKTLYQWSGVFIELSAPLWVSNSFIAFSDIDGDGESGCSITGTGSNQRISKLYTNDGRVFYRSYPAPFEGVITSSIAFSDMMATVIRSVYLWIC
jgi:hypothetical protein